MKPNFSDTEKSVIRRYNLWINKAVRAEEFQMNGVIPKKTIKRLKKIHLIAMGAHWLFAMKFTLANSTILVCILRLNLSERVQSMLNIQLKGFCAVYAGIMINFGS